jgi:hypothetical protein
LVLLIICCEKKPNKSDLNKNDVPADSPVGTAVLTLQEQIDNYKEDLVLLFQTEGDFTGSGNREVLAFYMFKGSYYNEQITADGVSRVYCFVCDEANNTIVKAILIDNYGTGIMQEYLEEMPLGALGRQIRWYERRQRIN